MASCSSLKHVPLPDHHHHHPTLWRKVRSVDDSAFAEILNELNIKGSHESSPFSSPFFNSSRTSSLSSTSSFSTNFPKRVENETPTIQKSLSVSNKRHTNSFSSMSSESLSMCTEDLGFESSDTFEDLLLNETSNDHISPSMILHHLFQETTRILGPPLLVQNVLAVGQNRILHVEIPLLVLPRDTTTSNKFLVYQDQSHQHQFGYRTIMCMFDSSKKLT